jgi:hypothetical protein
VFGKKRRRARSVAKAEAEHTELVARASVIVDTFLENFFIAEQIDPSTFMVYHDGVITLEDGQSIVGNWVERLYARWVADPSLIDHEIDLAMQCIQFSPVFKSQLRIH